MIRNQQILRNRTQLGIISRRGSALPPRLLRAPIFPLRHRAFQPRPPRLGGPA